MKKSTDTNCSLRGADKLFLPYFSSENFFSCIEHFLEGENLTAWCHDIPMTGAYASAVCCARLKWKLL